MKQQINYPRVVQIGRKLKKQSYEAHERIMRTKKEMAEKS
jgi:hypothetical protein